MRKLLHCYIDKLLRAKKETTNYEQSTTNRKSAGFTLIELLIVIALIGILSSFGVYSFQSSQKKARDGQRKSDLLQVKKALEAAKNDCLAGTYYPLNGGNGLADKYINIVNMLKTNGYLASSPQDPKFIDSGSFPVYSYDVGAQTTDACNINGVKYVGVRTYLLSAHLEIANDPDSAKSFTNCGLAVVAGDYAVCPD